MTENCVIIRYYFSWKRNEGGTTECRCERHKSGVKRRAICDCCFHTEKHIYVTCLHEPEFDPINILNASCGSNDEHKINRKRVGFALLNAMKLWKEQQIFPNEATRSFCHCLILQRNKSRLHTQRKKPGDSQADGCRKSFFMPRYKPKNGKATGLGLM